MRGTEILLTAEPRGVFSEGVISGTPKPGTMVEIKAGVALQNGRPTYEPLGTTSGSTGDPRPTCILLPDANQGQIFSTAYVTGARCKVYFPMAGDEMNVLVKGQAGTGSANEFDVGDRLTAEASDGKFILQSTSSVLAQARAMEDANLNIDADDWLFVQIQG